MSDKKHKPADACSLYLGTPVERSFSVVLTADPGDFSGTSEAHYIIENLVDRKTKPRDTTVCGSHYSGLLMGQPVLVVTTGAPTEGPPREGAVGHAAAQLDDPLTSGGEAHCMCAQASGRRPPACARSRW